MRLARKLGLNLACTAPSEGDAAKRCWMVTVRGQARLSNSSEQGMPYVSHTQTICSILEEKQRTAWLRVLVDA